MAKNVFLFLGVVFSLQGAAFVYALSPWGPAADATSEEVLSNLSLFGFPAAFLCFSAAHAISGRAVRALSLPYWQLGACMALWLLSVWLTMLAPWHLVTRLGAVVLAVAFGVVNLLRVKAT
jgi:hypothetical protein